MRISIFFYIAISIIVSYITVGMAHSFMGFFSEMFNTTAYTIFVYSTPLIMIFGGIAISSTSIYDRITSYMYGLRDPVPSETEKINEVANELKRRSGVNIDEYRFKMQDSEELNAFALNNRVIGVTRGTLQRMPPANVAEFVAHEIGHITHGDTQARKIASIVSNVHIVSFFVVGHVFSVALAISAYFAYAVSLSWMGVQIYDARTALFKLRLFKSVLYRPVVTERTSIVENAGFAPASFASRHHEFQADEFAVRCGFAEEAIQNNEYMMKMEGGDTRTWKTRIFDTHPKPAERIRHVHKLLEQSQKDPDFFNIPKYKEEKMSQISDKIILRVSLVLMVLSPIFVMINT